jgi:hypothetical protein
VHILKIASKIDALLKENCINSAILLCDELIPMTYKFTYRRGEESYLLSTTTWAKKATPNSFEKEWAIHALGFYIDYLEKGILHPPQEMPL